jgi:hypothetical protein
MEGSDNHAYRKLCRQVPLSGEIIASVLGCRLDRHPRAILLLTMLCKSIRVSSLSRFGFVRISSTEPNLVAS